MANVKQKQVVIERFGLEAVPSDLRTTTAKEYIFLQMAISVNAGNFLVPALAVLEGGLSFTYAFFSTIIGATIAFLFVSFLALPGANYGIPAQYALRSILGRKGSMYVASPVRTLTSLYWFSVQTIGGTYLIKEILDRFVGIQVSFVFIALFMATLMTCLALVGFQAVKKITNYFLPILLVSGVIMVYIFVSVKDPGKTFLDVLHNEGKNEVSTIIFYASLVFVQYISGVSSASDMARYGKTPTHAFYGLYVGNTLGFAFTAFLGAYTAVLAGTWNPYILATKFTASPILIAVIFIGAIASMITINLSNAYTGGYSLLNCLPKLGRVKSAIVFGACAITLSLFPALVDDAKNFISYLGAFIIPLSSVIVTDFLLIKKKQLQESDFEQLENQHSTFNKEAFISIILGICLYWLLPEWTSPGFLTFIVSGIIYFSMKKPS